MTPEKAFEKHNRLLEQIYKDKEKFLFEIEEICMKHGFFFRAALRSDSVMICEYDQDSFDDCRKESLRHPF